MTNIFFILILLFSISSCVKTTSQNTEDIEVIKMSKTSCRGNCPQYSIIIYNSKKVLLDAKSNLQFEGKYSLKLNDEQYKTLVKSFEDTGFDNFKAEYTAKVTDLPTTYISYLTNDSLYTVKDYYGAPKELKMLENNIANLLELEGWEKYEL
ncbi:hypothetical protein EI427_15315 [Flammeovirga pectinis]|uniref:DUF6438 domain-containing protein n=1 Tax=Flammeovirga pectinis TaxID=2494373 RepID=A0A3S9P5P0_9BACT|nr:DUF6438 domain-containing protein [Flammeovirga pectinis]AZQ63540.1 hypothetical protein EI427_15315 [Flammeovirga pectinis]